MGVTSILIVADDDDERALLDEALTRLGHEVRAARDGDDALGVLASFSPRVVVMDIDLPGMSGYELAHKIRSLDGLATSHLIALTGHRRLTLDVAFDAHLVKPNNIATLIAAFPKC
jgi:CheY-like chemotaxis protein